jgi:uncharacterized repeat protein (TIGR03803 family)
MTNTKQKSAPKAPTHRAFHVREGKNGGKGFWTPIGAAWAHDDGNGFNIQIDVMPLGVVSCFGGSDAGAGTVFRITPSGRLTTLYNFCSQSGCTDGEYPNALMQASNGLLYGTTGQGGANGAGTVFKITAAGALTTLVSFDGADGSGPDAGLVQASNGDLYGTTAGGGASGGTNSNAGTVFKITPSGKLTTLYSFALKADARTAKRPWRRSSKPPTETFTGQLLMAAPTASGRSSRSPRAAS